MKNFTFLFALLILISAAHAQSPKFSENKIRKLQERSAHYLKVAATLQHHSARISADNTTILKSAQETITLDSIISQDYMAETDSWLNEEKDSYLYNNDLSGTEMLSHEWNATSETWELNMRTELGYNNAGLINELIISDKDELLGEVIPETRISAFYSSEGLLDSVWFASTEDQETWITNGRQIYFYNETDQLIQMDLVILNEDEEEDEEDVTAQAMSYYYEYNNQGQLESSRMVYNDDEIEFIMEETAYFYDDSGRRISIEYSALNLTTMTSEIDSRTEFEYNETGDVSTQTYSSWDDDQQEWIIEEKDEYTYSNTSFSEVVYPNWINLLGINDVTNEFSNAVTEINTFSFLNEEWILDERTSFYYSDGTSTSSPQIADAMVNVYPNPFSDILTFSFSNYNQLSLEIFNVTGSKILDRKIYPAADVKVSNLNKGVYLFRLLNDNQIIHSGKLIKR